MFLLSVDRGSTRDQIWWSDICFTTSNEKLCSQPQHYLWRCYAQYHGWAWQSSSQKCRRWWHKWSEKSYWAWSPNDSWLVRYVKKSVKCTDMKIHIYPLRDKIRAYNSNGEWLSEPSNTQWYFQIEFLHSRMENFYIQMWFQKVSIDRSTFYSARKAKPVSHQKHCDTQKDLKFYLELIQYPKAKLFQKAMFFVIFYLL